MDNFIHKHECLIKKIKQTSEGWEFYPKDKKEKILFISKQNYNGKMPPFFKWPWAKLNLRYSEFRNFIIMAELNDVKLFEIQQECWPEDIKNAYFHLQELLKKATDAEAEEDELIKRELLKYLELIPNNTDLEKDIKSLHVCLRAPLLAWYYLKVNNKEEYKRLTLLYKLYDIVGRLYMRHVNPSDTIGGALDVWYSLMMVRFLPLLLTYRLDGQPKENIDIVTSDDLYQEIARELARQLPEIENKPLFYYIVYIIHHLYMKFTLDFAKWYNGLSYTGRERKRICDDEREYKCSADKQKMELPLYSTFILPSFTKEEFKVFLNRYSLK